MPKPNEDSIEKLRRLKREFVYKEMAKLDQALQGAHKEAQLISKSIEALYADDFDALLFKYKHHYLASLDQKQSEIKDLESQKMGLKEKMKRLL